MMHLKNIMSICLIFSCLLSIAGSRFADSALMASAAPQVMDIEQKDPDPVKQTPIEIPAKEIKEEVTTKITMSFIGDCLIATASGATDRGSLNWTANNQPSSYFFEKVADIFLNDDFTVANCENVLTDSAFTPITKDDIAFWFKSATKNASIFQSGNVDIVSVANNHTGDYGKAGYSDTINALKSVGMKVGYNNNPVIVEKEGIRVGIICCDLWCYSHYNRTINQLKEIESDTDIQIVYFHGGTEKIHEPEAWKKNAARKIVDAGADLVIGGHPHVLQPMEIYNDVPIVYSLGNFVYGGNRQPENQTIIFQASFIVKEGKISISTNIIPCYVYTGKTNNWQPDRIMNETEKTKVLDFMNGRRDLPY